MRVSNLISFGIEAIIFTLVIVVFLLIVWGIGYKLIYQKIMGGKEKLCIKQIIPKALLSVVILVILFATLLSGRMGGGIVLEPFSAYKQAWYFFNLSEWRNIILNICMFIPFGFILPFAIKQFKTPWKTYLAGLLFSLGIESVQLILKRGVFETDDLINNLLGTMIGYGFFLVVMLIIKKKPFISVIGYQIPLVVVVAVFSAIFYSYNTKELGNLECENTSSFNMPDVILGDDIKLSKGATTANIYKEKIASLDETHKYAEQIFALQDKKIDENRVDEYDDTVIYHSEDDSLNLWVEFKGMTASYSDFDQSFGDNEDECEYLIGADEETVRDALKKTGFEIPEKAVFSSVEDSYFFEIKSEKGKDEYSTGTATCRINDKGKVVNVEYNIVSCEPYKTVDIISAEEAYELLCKGEFYYNDHTIERDMPYTVKDVRLTYRTDTKGFYRPVYEFVLVNDECEGEIHIDILGY